VAAFPTIGVLLLNGCWNEPLNRASPTGFRIADAFTHVVVPVSMLAWLAVRHDVGRRNYGFTRWRERRSDLIGLTLLAAALFWVSYEPVAAFFGHLLLSEGAAVTYVDVMPSSSLLRLPVAIYCPLSAAVFEEILYRGLPHVYYMRGFTVARPGL
jgi:membrane protease YdiL (CAAX protease family)